MLISDYKHFQINISLIGTQQVRKIKQDIFFMYKLLNGFIYCLDLLSKLPFLLLGHATPQANTFYVSFQCTFFNIDLFVGNYIISFNLFPSNLLIFNHLHLYCIPFKTSILSILYNIVVVLFSL